MSTAQTCPSELSLDAYLMSPARPTEALHGHVTTCATCQERVALAERCMARVSPEQIEAVLAAGLAAASRPADAPASARWSPAWLKDLWAGLPLFGGRPVLAAVTLALLVGVVVIGALGGPFGRGDGSDPYLGLKSGVALALGLERRGLALPDGEGLRVGDQLELIVTLGAPAELFVFSVDAQGDVSPVLPATGGWSRSMPAGPLRLAIRVDDGAPDERLFAVAAPEAFKLGEVISRASRLVTRGARIESMDRLGLPGSFQTASRWFRRHPSGTKRPAI